MKFTILTTVQLFLFFAIAKCEVRLPAIIGSHMVLQQNSQVKLWGWCGPNEKIKVSTTWDTTTYSCKGQSNAKWLLTINTPTAGGPFSITIQGDNKIELQDVMIGEVWVCSGQSNMQMNYNWGLKQYTNEVENASNKRIRFFLVPQLTAPYPQEDTKAKWVVCSPDEMKQFSTAGYFFGKKLNEILNVPVGLIGASWGGTPAEVWTPNEVVDNDSTLLNAAKELHPSDGWPTNPGATYNAMIHPLVNYNITGTIWYQGESNVGTNKTYQSLFTQMIGAWRKAWQKEFPFYFVQIAPYAGYGNNDGAALLREAQTKSTTYPKTGMIVTTDLVDNVNDIHPKFKREVGERLANYALADTYGQQNIFYKSPVYKNMVIENNKIIISFENAPNGLMSKDSLPSKFYIAGLGKIFVKANAKIVGNTVVVSAKEVKKPVAVRFGFTDSDMPNLFSKEGLPVNTFRTDDWDVLTISTEKLPEP